MEEPDAAEVGGAEAQPGQDGGEGVESRAQWQIKEVGGVEPLSLAELRHRCALLSAEIRAHLRGRAR
ncbi:hypothetical protein MTQ01_08990 [Streptomyces sp. XM4193]|uniref:hypothetical protein n=1 Tax=Streptomyces sp. XM4193 TaxID=2929782 RepID=UPI001FFA913B|nr:hypothetical protein [Streptomyces sp. XM4193]MCK1796138.1 hypothetical protein [Streptomyces sp. XM4193]